MKILNDGTKQPEEISLDNTTFEGNKNYDNFGGTDSGDIKQIVLIPSRSGKTGIDEPYKYLVAMTPPYLQNVEIYQGSTKKYKAHWQWNELKKKLELFPDEQKNRQVSSIKAGKTYIARLTFNKPVKEIKAGLSYSNAPAVVMCKIPGTDGKVWEGTVSVHKDNSGIHYLSVTGKER